MLEAFSRPRIEGWFSGDGMRAWNVVWGKGRADVVIENSYARSRTPSSPRGRPRSRRRACSRSGYPRKDGGEQINARVG